jgi:hypothetical protein
VRLGSVANAGPPVLGAAALIHQGEDLDSVADLVEEAVRKPPQEPAADREDENRAGARVADRLFDGEPSLLQERDAEALEPQLVVIDCLQELLRG